MVAIALVEVCGRRKLDVNAPKIKVVNVEKEKEVSLITV